MLRFEIGALTSGAVSTTSSIANEGLDMGAENNAVEVKTK